MDIVLVSSKILISKDILPYRELIRVSLRLKGIQHWRLRYRQAICLSVEVEPFLTFILTHQTLLQSYMVLIAAKFDVEKPLIQYFNAMTLVMVEMTNNQWNILKYY